MSSLEPTTVIAAAAASMLTLGVIVMIEDDTTKKLRLVSLGEFKGSNLSNYFMDKDSNLYSRNGLSWEINPVKDRDLLKLSNNSTDNSGNTVNSFRDSKGKKVTVRRDYFNYYVLKDHYGFIDIEVAKVTSRHFKVLAKNVRGIHGLN